MPPTELKASIPEGAEHFELADATLQVCEVGVDETLLKALKEDVGAFVRSMGGRDVLNASRTARRRVSATMGRARAAPVEAARAAAAVPVRAVGGPRRPAPVPSLSKSTAPRRWGAPAPGARRDGGRPLQAGLDDAGLVRSLGGEGKRVGRAEGGPSLSLAGARIQ